jgi:hypothetical protein
VVQATPQSQRGNDQHPPGRVVHVSDSVYRCCRVLRQQRGHSADPLGEVTGTAGGAGEDGIPPGMQWVSVFLSAAGSVPTPRERRWAAGWAHRNWRTPRCCLLRASSDLAASVTAPSTPGTSQRTNCIQHAPAPWIGASEEQRSPTPSKCPAFTSLANRFPAETGYSELESTSSLKH